MGGVVFMMKYVLVSRIGLVLGVIFLLTVQACDGHIGQQQEGDSDSSYADLVSREIKTLSEDDIEQLRNGAGWGFALAAELNGLPGPLHLLELAREDVIHLDDAQLRKIQELRADMLYQAVPLGEYLIEQERRLNTRFADGNLTERELEELLTEIAATTARLRFVHLATHLETARVLTQQQIAHYNNARGYSGDHSHGHHVH